MLYTKEDITELEKEGQSQLFFFKTEQELINNKMKTIKINIFVKWKI